MGGHAAGEVASRIAVDTVLEYFEGQASGLKEDSYLNDAPLGARLLAEAVKQANDAILEYADAHKNTSGMGTTLVAARFAEGNVSIANVGDSRIYLLREGDLLQLTEDHSLVMEQVRRGMLTVEEAKRSSAQNIITRALGTDDTTLPDLGEFPAQAGDVLLLATDGVLRHVEDDEIRNILLQVTVPESCLRDPDRRRQRRWRRRQFDLRAGACSQRERRQKPSGSPRTSVTPYLLAILFGLFSGWVNQTVDDALLTALCVLAFTMLLGVWKNGDRGAGYCWFGWGSPSSSRTTISSCAGRTIAARSTEHSCNCWPPAPEDSAATSCAR